MRKPEFATYLVKKNNKNLLNTTLELNWSRKLSPIRSHEYLLARSHARYLLSLIHNISPLDIPFFSPPGNPPELKNDLGFISISHCSDVCLIGWSRYPIGVDIERKNRNFRADKIIKYFSDSEKLFLCKYKSKEFDEKVLEHWVIKEAAFKLIGGNLIKELKRLTVDTKSKTITINKNILKSYFILNFKEWKIALTLENRLKNINPIICFEN